MSVHEHKQAIQGPVRCGIITVSDTRTVDTDKSGRLMKEKLLEGNHEIIRSSIIRDEKASILQELHEYTAHPTMDVILMNGGTGIASRDVTIEALESIFEKEMPGFGEIFRMLSYTEDIGSAAILSRAAAGVVNGKAVFSTPGSSGAVKLAMDKLILPELRHVVRELRKDQ
ncbi:MogA/MoaB family molybdenum cofactor biosynthesis protein [Halobacillus litoralis]|uniref:MogA/MoaB family molybdenum cofactor biosynthesis protein n=1 Tax=Halobacillus litoralis TaxID=45668 RepID=UPI00136A9C65|nr:molybdenum cofactor biosynthesis protein B [Halobacillus litoralis]MYL38969.1 molybdenum cofactor biosynthesis protein [Halobacillus litoralis]